MPTHPDDYYESLDKTRRAGTKPHRAQIFREGWALDCECGAQFVGDSKAGVMRLYRSHLAFHAKKPIA